MNSTVLILVWLVVTYLTIRKKEIEMADSNQTSAVGSSWFRVWVSPGMSEGVEGVDYIDIISETSERAVQDSDQYLPVGRKDACHAVRMGTAQDYSVLDEWSQQLVVGDSDSDWGLDDIAVLGPRSSD